jgi:hypothetical protein
MVVFDADMVAKPNFFTKILEVMLDDDCALCLTPQGFNNVDAQSDIFNNLNLSFWEYMLPGTDALGYIACTGACMALCCSLACCLAAASKGYAAKQLAGTVAMQGTVCSLHAMQQLLCW